MPIVVIASISESRYQCILVLLACDLFSIGERLNSTDVSHITNSSFDDNENIKQTSGGEFENICDLIYENLPSTHKRLIK